MQQKCFKTVFFHFHNLLFSKEDLFCYLSLSHVRKVTQLRWQKTPNCQVNRSFYFKMLAFKWCSNEQQNKRNLNKEKMLLGYPELCHNRLGCFCFVLNLVEVEVEIRWHAEFGRILFRIGSKSNFEWVTQFFWPWIF